MIAELHIKIHVVSHEAKEEAEAAPLTDSRLTHVSTLQEKELRQSKMV